MRTTKSLSIALERATELLPGGEVDAPSNGRRRLLFTRPDKGTRTVEGTIGRCLYVALMVLFTSKELGGLGIDLAEVRDAIRLRPEAVPDSGAHGWGAHERAMVAKAALTREEMEEFHA